MGQFRETACLAAAALFLSGCFGGHGGAGETAPASTAAPARIKAATPQAPAVALFQPSQGVLPYPTDLYFAGSTDGTLNIQSDSASSPGLAAVNTLDGFSTTTVIRARFGAPLDPASLTAQSVIILQVTIDNTTKATTSVVHPLTLGVDYTTAVGAEGGPDNTVLEIRPTHPLAPSTGTANIGYLVLLTRGITGAGGSPAAPDTDYANIKAALPTCSAIRDNTLHGICQLTGAHLQMAQQIGINPADVVLSFSFSTQSIDDSLVAIEETAAAQPLILHNTQLTTAQVNPHLSGHATVYVGSLTAPYYLSRSRPLTGYWQGNPSELDASSRYLTRFNPVPVATEMLQVPVLVTVPNANSAGGGVKPPGRWPVVIFAHGFARNRTDMLAVADAFADSGFVVVAIDLPLHGLTDPTSRLYASSANPLYAGIPLPAAGSIERTFDLDAVNNTTGGLGADGRVDSSGADFINAASPLTLRDNLRQAVADLITLTLSLPNMHLGNDAGEDIDTASIHFLGTSLGAIVGGVFMGVVPGEEISSATLAMPGGGLARLLRDSPTLGPKFTAALQAQGLAAGTAPFEQFLRDVQTAVDPADPLNYIEAATAHHPIHLVQIIGSESSPPDQVVPHSATQRLIDVGALVRTPAPGSSGEIVKAGRLHTYVNLIVGDHGSLVDPTASLATTTEMQAEAIAFAGAAIPPIPQLSIPGLPATPPGTALLVLHPTVIQP